MRDIRDIIRLRGKFVIGMVHCLPLPGSPAFGGSVDAVMEQAVEDARTLERAGVDALVVENMGDSPFTTFLSKPQVAALSTATALVRQVVGVPVGVDAAFNDCEAGLGIAVANGCDFVRVPVFVDTAEYYGGFIEPCAYLAIDTRRRLGAQDVMLLCDVQVKHTNMVLPHVTIETSARNAASAGADAIIVTGSSIGEETPIEMIGRVRGVTSLPVIAGSGVSLSNIADQLEIADGAIIGSSLKRGGVISNPVDYDLVREILEPLGR